MASYPIECAKCGCKFKIATECDRCGYPPALDDPNLTNLQRQRLVELRQREVRLLRSMADVLVHNWITGRPRYRRRRALAAKGYARGHVWPPIPAELKQTRPRRSQRQDKAVI
jgi:hypothetical protein